MKKKMEKIFLNVKFGRILKRKLVEVENKN